MTRKDKSKLVVLVTGGLVFAAAALFAGVERTGGETADASGESRPDVGRDVETARDTVEAGRELFRTVGCTGCHSAEGVGNDRLPLDGVGSRLSADTLRAWVVDPRSVAPGVRKPAYDDLAEEEVDALVVYMLSLTETDGG